METDERRYSETIAKNLAEIRKRVAEAAKGVGRSPNDIQIVAVTKGQSASIVRAAANAGLSCFGENYVQEALAKQNDLADLADLGWHFIGHLQSNKAALTVGRFALIQTIDRERLARKVSEAASRRDITQDVLVQVHLGDEETKFGVTPPETPALCAKIASFQNISVRGLMGIAPGGPADPRPHFARLRTLFEEMPEENRQTLSMGMSGDFEAAIQEGATVVRIGTALLGQRGS